jgi:hypothetical protein
MTDHIVELLGNLRADGTLVLDTNPNLPPGRVRVRIQQAEEGIDVIEVLRRIRADQAARGHIPRSREEVDADIAAMRQEDEERMQEIERLHEECQRTQQAGASSEQK